MPPVDHLSDLRGRLVLLPDGSPLGVVSDVIVESDAWACTHLFVGEPNPSRVERSVPVAIPWRWVKALDEVVLLRWFPDEMVPFDPNELRER